MRTEQLIRAMAADATRTPPVAALLPAALVPALLVAVACFAAFLGVRPGLGEALTQARVLVKQGFPLLLAVAAFGAALRLARPGMGAGRWPLALAAVPALLVLAVAAELVAVPAADWGAAMMGHSIGTCLPSIVLLSLPVLAATLWALRQGASVHPALSGAVAGLLSGGLGAGLYAFFCNEDSPLFYGVWYVLAILGVAALGAFIGGRLLRW
jgi:hypothetical protein